jgi:hypothetical protein
LCFQPHWIPCRIADRQNRSRSSREGAAQLCWQHRLQFAETGEYFLKSVVDSPENVSVATNTTTTAFTVSTGRSSRTTSHTHSISIYFSFWPMITKKTVRANIPVAAHSCSKNGPISILSSSIRVQDETLCSRCCLLGLHQETSLDNEKRMFARDYRDNSKFKFDPAGETVYSFVHPRYESQNQQGLNNHTQAAAT